MATAAGIAAFLRPDVNACLRDLLNAYGEFLKSPDSAKVLNRSAEGWLNDAVLESMSREAHLDVPGSGINKKSFHEIFECDPSAPAYGFKSWDDFFTRRFLPGARPVHALSDGSVIVNACESKAVLLRRDAKLRDSFWLKGQPYSLADMFGNEADAVSYEGGTVYQAYLSSTSYHRWHAPVTGTVRKIVQIPGTYYAENGAWGSGFIDESGVGDHDPAGQGHSMMFLCQVATRSIMLLDADNDEIGETALLMVGMAEVSSCEWTVEVGDHVEKGQEIGMVSYKLQYSSSCIVHRALCGSK